MANKYKSRYTERLVSAADLVSHLICENLALKKGIDLPEKFWSTSEFWLREFKKQQRMARGLIQIYGEEVLIEFTRQPEFRKIFSLGAQWIVDPALTFLAEQRKRKLDQIDKIVEKEPEHVDKTIKDHSRPSFKQTNRGKLKDL